MTERDVCQPDGPRGAVDFSGKTQEEIRRHFALMDRFCTWCGPDQMCVCGKQAGTTWDRSRAQEWRDEHAVQLRAAQHSYPESSVPATDDYAAIASAMKRIRDEEKPLPRMSLVEDIDRDLNSRDDWSSIFSDAQHLWIIEDLATPEESHMLVEWCDVGGV